MNSTMALFVSIWVCRIWLRTLFRLWTILSTRIHDLGCSFYLPLFLYFFNLPPPPPPSKETFLVEYLHKLYRSSIRNIPVIIAGGVHLIFEVHVEP